MDYRKRNTHLESVFVIIIIICFVIATAALISSGERSFNRILQTKNETENTRIAFSYINMRIRQNDIAGKILFKENAVENSNAIIIYHTGEEEGLVTYIYHSDGKLWECYTYIQNTPSLDYSFEIIPIDNISMEYNKEKGYFIISSLNKKGLKAQQLISIRSGGNYDYKQQ